MSILVTGAAGFIGSHLALFLAKTFPERTVLALDRIDECSSLENLAAAPENLRVVVGSVEHNRRVAKLLRAFQVKWVLHLAAQTHVDNSFGNSLEFTHDNVTATHHLLEVVREYGQVEKFVHMSTDECYGEVDDDHLGVKEDAAFFPTSPYSASKAAAEHLCYAYFRSYKIPIVICRCNNVIGPNQYPEKVLPKFILQARFGLPFTIQGSGMQKRSFVYVDDVVEALYLILAKGEVGLAYNISTPDELTVLQIVERVAHGLGKEIQTKQIPDRQFNDWRYAIDGSRLAELGWKKKTPLDEAIRKTIAWYSKVDPKKHWLYFSEDMLG